MNVVGDSRGSFALVTQSRVSSLVVCLVEKGLDDLVFGNRLDDFAGDEDLTFAVAPEETPSSASRASPGPLTTPPMTAMRSGTGNPPKAAGDLFGEVVDDDLGSSAGGARHDLEAPGSQAEGCEDLVADLDFLNGWGGQRPAYGVANPLGQQHSKATADLMVP
jgi:hypothetical protein